MPEDTTPAAREMLGTMDTEGSREVPVGQEFTVSLPLAGGTGYRWECSDLPDAIAVVRSLPRVPSSPAPGAEAHQAFELRATGSAGRAVDVRFVLRRPWESEPAARHTERVRITGAPKA